MTQPLRAVEFYSGVGGMHFALDRCSQAVGLHFEVVMAFEINTNANVVYRANFRSPVAQKSIQDHPQDFFQRLGAEVFVMSPPCQPYTRVGLQKGGQDTRAESFFFILDLIKNLPKGPEFILIENVKGFETSDTREDTVRILHECGYHFVEFLLSPSQFGIPNSRLRYYLVARKRPFESLRGLPESNSPLELIPGRQDSLPISSIHDYLDTAATTTNEELLIPSETLRKWGILFDIVTAESRNSCCFTKAYGTYVEGTGSVFNPMVASKDEAYEEYSRRELREGDDNPLLKLKMRYFSPREIANLMNFPESMKFPTEISTKQYFKLLGNSLNVLVVSELLTFLFKAE